MLKIPTFCDSIANFKNVKKFKGCFRHKFFCVWLYFIIHSSAHNTPNKGMNVVKKVKQLERHPVTNLMIQKGKQIVYFLCIMGDINVLRKLFEKWGITFNSPLILVSVELSSDHQLHIGKGRKYYLYRSNA